MTHNNIIMQSISYRVIKTIFGYLLVSRSFAIVSSCAGAISGKFGLILSNSESYRLVATCIKSSVRNSGYLISSVIVSTTGIYFVARYLGYREVGLISIITVSLALLCIHPAGIKIIKYSNTVFRNSIVCKVLNIALLK